MDDPNITMEEYIQLMADKARERHQTFNWETTTYDDVYCEDLDSFTDFETDFPAIVYNDASTSNQNISSEPIYKFPLPVKVVATARRFEMPLPKVCTAIEEKKKKLPVKDRWQLH
nr:hypothetical protein [Tanacetum cinerariifolium]